ncbi:MAG: hypothetical protein U5J96_07450 [Ignavibacteriaceae bacterium]|nr:hypothetical protein [Ignavibacteriaceae bacterium]
MWTYDTAILNGGTPTFSLVPGFSDFAASAYPPSALITSPNILRTSSNLPGSNGHSGRWKFKTLQVQITNFCFFLQF